MTKRFVTIVAILVLLPLFAVAQTKTVKGVIFEEETGLPLNTVRTRIRRAKAQIDKMKTEESI